MSTNEVTNMAPGPTCQTFGKGVAVPCAECNTVLVDSQELAELRAMAAAEPVAWAISYDGKTPYSLFCEDDCALLDLEVKRLGGTACKLALYSAHIAPAIPALTDEEVSGRFGGYGNVARWGYELAAERAGAQIKDPMQELADDSKQIGLEY